jgi:hypothetical protein
VASNQFHDGNLRSARSRGETLPCPELAEEAPAQHSVVKL